MGVGAFGKVFTFSSFVEKRAIMNSNLENFVPQVMMVRKKETGQVYAMKALDKREVAVSERCVIIPLFNY